MKEVPKWLIGVLVVAALGLLVYGILGIKKASEPEVDRSKPPKNFYDRNYRGPGTTNPGNP